MSLQAINNELTYIPINSNIDNDIWTWNLEINDLFLQSRLWKLSKLSMTTKTRL